MGCKHSRDRKITEWQRNKIHDLQRTKDQLQKEADSRRQNILEYQRRIENLEKEKDALLTRLSAVTSAQLLNNNPDIADLSDQNRPTKLAEQFSELYDNEWTLTYDSLTSAKHGKTEEEAIQILLQAFLESYKYCDRIAKSQIEALNSFGGIDELPIELQKALKDNRKRKYEKQFKSLNKPFREHMKNIFKKKIRRKLKKFLKDSLRLTWLMVIQDPPVYIDVETDHKGEKFDKKVYKAYTKSGDVIRYIVWPPVFLYKGGALLAKGVAQGQNSTELHNDITRVKETREVVKTDNQMHENGASGTESRTLDESGLNYEEINNREKEDLEVKPAGNRLKSPVSLKDMKPSLEDITQISMT